MVCHTPHIEPPKFTETLNQKEVIMPATVAMKGGKWRVVEADSGRIVKRNGTSVDGGGFDSKEKAQAQAKAINANS